MNRPHTRRVMQLLFDEYAQETGCSAFDDFAAWERWYDELIASGPTGRARLKAIGVDQHIMSAVAECDARQRGLYGQRH